MAKIGKKIGTKFDKAIEARTPDRDCPGWDVLHLECGHLSHAPSSTTHRVEYCGVCYFDHQAHLRAVRQIEARLAPSQGAQLHENI